MNRATGAPRPGPRWLSTAEAADIMGTSDWWIRQRIESGAIRARSLSSARRRIYRIWGPDLELFLDETIDRAGPGDT